MSSFLVEDRGGFRQVPVNRLMTIGRSPSNDLVLNAVFASRRHAWVWSQGEHVFLEDLGSTYGTLVNGQSVKSPVFLNYNDVIHMGEARLTFVAERDPTAERTPPRGMPRLMASQIFCARCGAANDPRLHYCGNCGYRLDFPPDMELGPEHRLGSQAPPAASHPITPLEPVMARPFPTDGRSTGLAARPASDRRLWVLILFLAMLAVILVTIVAALLVMVLG
jgi:ribosomal protein L40E